MVSAIGEEDEDEPSGAEEGDGDESTCRQDSEVSSLRLGLGSARPSELLGRAPSIASIPGGPLRHEDLLKRLYDTSRAYQDYKRLGFEFELPLTDYMTHSPHCSAFTVNLRLAIGNSHYGLCRRYTYSTYTYTSCTVYSLPFVYSYTYQYCTFTSVLLNCTQSCTVVVVL